MIARFLRRAALAGTAAALTLPLSLAAAPVLAADTVADIDDLSRVERIAEDLARSPVYVHHSLHDPDLAAAELALHTRVATGPVADLDVRVVVYPSVPADETGGRPSLFLHALHEATGSDGVYVAVTADGRAAVATFNSAVEPPEVDSGALTGTHLDRADAVLDLLEEASVGSVDSSGLGSDAPPDPDDAVLRPRGSVDEFWSAALFPGTLIGVALVVVRIRISGPSTWRPLRSWLPRRGRRRAAPVPYRRHRAPYRAWFWWLRPALSHELRRLHQRVEAVPADHPRRHEAVRAYDAAGLIGRSPELPAQAWVCAVVLARNGVHLLDHPDEPLLQPCQVNPLHGPAIRRRNVPVPSDPRRSEVWRVCDRCAGRRDGPRIGLLRPVLTIPAEQGPVAYRHARRDVWARALARPDVAPAHILKELEV